MVAALSQEDGKAIAFAGPDGAKLADALDELSTSTAAAELLVEDVRLCRAVRRRHCRAGGTPAAQPNARIRILGLLEARLTDSDRVVLGGLVEGTWPPESRTDAWLSRPMRLALGLDLPERRIGLTAHDFAQLLGAPEVILTRAAKIAGAPTVPSRFIQRLAAVAGTRWQAAIERGETYLGLGARTRPARQGRGRRRSRRRNRRARRGRNASRSPRSKTGCAIPIRSTPSTSCAWRRSIRSMSRRAPPSAARSFTPPSATSPQLYADGLPADPVRDLIALGRSRISPRWKIFRRRARSGGRASNASRTGSATGNASGAPRLPPSPPKFAARSTFRSTTASSRCAALPIASSA